MTTKAAEDFEDIARRLKELEAERQEALTGSSAPVQPKEVDVVFGDYTVGYFSTANVAAAVQYLAANPGSGYVDVPMAFRAWKLTGSSASVDLAKVGEYALGDYAYSGTTFNIPDFRGRVKL